MSRLHIFMLLSAPEEAVDHFIQSEKGLSFASDGLTELLNNCTYEQYLHCLNMYFKLLHSGKLVVSPEELAESYWFSEVKLSELPWVAPSTVENLLLDTEQLSGAYYSNHWDFKITRTTVREVEDLLKGTGQAYKHYPGIHLVDVCFLLEYLQQVNYYLRFPRITSLLFKVLVSAGSSSYFLGPDAARVHRLGLWRYTHESFAEPKMCSKMREKIKETISRENFCLQEYSRRKNVPLAHLKAGCEKFGVVFPNDTSDPETSFNYIPSVDNSIFIPDDYKYILQQRNLPARLSNPSGNGYSTDDWETLLDKLAFKLLFEPHTVKKLAAPEETSIKLMTSLCARITLLYIKSKEELDLPAAMWRVWGSTYEHRPLAEHQIDLLKKYYQACQGNYTAGFTADEQKLLKNWFTNTKRVNKELTALVKLLFQGASLNPEAFVGSTEAVYLPERLESSDFYNVFTSEANWLSMMQEVPLEAAQVVPYAELRTAFYRGGLHSRWSTLAVWVAVQEAQRFTTEQWVNLLSLGNIAPHEAVTLVSSLTEG